MKFSLSMRGLEAWNTNPFLSGKNGVRPLIEMEMERAASTTAQNIRWGYEQSNNIQNSYVTQVVDRAVRITSGSPLYKTQQLANSVEYIKTADMRYEVRINPEAVSSHGGKQTPLQNIAVYQENGYSIIVDEKMHRFFKFVSVVSKDKQFYPPSIGRVLDIPARPVWGPVIEKMDSSLSSYFYENIKNALYMTGKTPAGPNRGAPFKRKYSPGSKFRI